MKILNHFCPLRHAFGVPPPPKGEAYERLSLWESSREAGERAKRFQGFKKRII